MLSSDENDCKVHLLALIIEMHIYHTHSFFQGNRREVEEAFSVFSFSLYVYVYICT